MNNSHAPQATKMQPATRETNLPNGNAFSNKTTPASAAIHNRRPARHTVARELQLQIGGKASVGRGRVRCVFTA